MTKTQRAIVVQGRGHAMLVQDVPLPALPDDYILVRTKAIALNPTDWKHIDFEGCTGTIVGCDYSGIIESVGSKVSKFWNKGDRVAGFVHGCNAVRPQGGAFAEYVIAKAGLQLHIPDSMSFEAAATLGVGITTVGQNLYQSLQLAEPAGMATDADTGDEKASILIYGGATATGTLAIQFAKLSGLQVITICSDANRPLMYQLGADRVFDYHDVRVGEQIRDDTDDSLELVLDTISTIQSAAICADAISSAGGCYNALMDVRCPREDVDSTVSFAYSLIGERYRLGSEEVEGDRANLDFGIQWWNTVEALLQAGRIVPHRYQIKPGGLSGVPDGLQILREGKLRACKLVYRTDDI